MPASELFELFKSNGYRFGACSVRAYDRFDTVTYADDFLIQLYRASKRTLAITFCGMSDLSAPAICAYLAARSPLLLMCVDNPDGQDGFEVIGYSFPTIWSGPPTHKIDPDPGRSMFLGYTGFRQWYGRPELTVCMMLSGIFYFHIYNLINIQGQRYAENRLTKRFLTQFGVRDTGVLPKFLFDGKQMRDAVLSCLDREDFTAYVSKAVLSCSKI